MSDLSSPRGVPNRESSATQAGTLDTLERFAECRLDGYLSMANVWVQHYHLNTVRFDAEDAIIQALLEICQRIHEGSLELLDVTASLERWFPAVLRQVIIDRARLQHAGKRGGIEKTVYLSTLEESDLDKLDASSARPEEIVSAAEEYQKLLDRLGDQQPWLRSVAVMKMKGYTHDEIARMLHVSTDTVGRGLRTI